MHKNQNYDQEKLYKGTRITHASICPDFYHDLEIKQ